MPWLILRGLAREARHWGDFPETLARVTGDEVHTLDHPGAGTECERASPVTIRGFVDDLRRRWLPMRERAVGDWGLLGISLGGMVTMQWGADHPTDFARVVLANTSGGDLNPPWQRMRWGVLPAIGRAIADRDDVRRERRILGATTRLVADPDAVASRFATFLRDRPMTRANVLRQLFAATRFRAPRSLAMPVLVLGSAKDALTHPDCPRRLARRFHAPLEVHPDAGHDLSADAPEWMAERVRDWVARTGRQVA